MTIVINTQEELEALIVDGCIAINNNLRITCDVSVEVDIKAWNIKAGNINAGNIDARDINAWNIKAGNINAGNINAGNIDARDINAGNIDARNINVGNINARDINAEGINAGNIDYYAVCFAYNYIACTSIKGKRYNNKHFCLDGKINFKEEIKKKVTPELTQEQIDKIQSIIKEK